MLQREIPAEWTDAADIVNLVREPGRISLSDRINERFQAGTDNRQAIRAMIDAGLHELTLPRRYSGMGRDYLALVWCWLPGRQPLHETAGAERYMAAAGCSSPASLSGRTGAPWL